MIDDAGLDQLRERFIEAQPTLAALRAETVELIERSLAARGLVATTVEARVKDVSSFVKKVLRKNYSDPWEQIRDKLGVRLVTPYASMVPDLEQLVRDTFAVHSHEDKRNALAPEKLDYLGIHFEVSLPSGNDRTDLATAAFEIQIHTVAEVAWAAVAHEFMYKTPEDPPDDIKRSIYRLLALVELFDLEVSRCQEVIMSSPAFAQGQLLIALERHYYTLTARRSDPQLSKLVLGVLAPMLSEAERAGDAQELDQFVSQYHDKLESLYGEYLSDDRNVVLSQPESLLIFEQLERDPFRLTELWRQELPMRLLQSLSEIWGVPVQSDE